MCSMILCGIKSEFSSLWSGNWQKEKKKKSSWENIENDATE